MGIESQTLISLRRCTGCFARKPTIGGFHPQNVSQNLWVLEPSWNSTPQNRTVLLHVPPGIKDLKVYSATQNLRKVVLLWKLRVLGPWILHVKGLNFRNPSTRTSTIYLEAKWPLFLKVNPPKQGPFQIKTRAPIWVPGIYIYIYLCTVEAAAFLFSARPVGFSRLWSPELLSGGSTTPAGGPFKDIFKPQHPIGRGGKGQQRYITAGDAQNTVMHSLRSCLDLAYCAQWRPLHFFFLHGLWVFQGCGHPNFYQVDPPRPQVVPSKTSSNHNIPPKQQKRETTVPLAAKDWQRHLLSDETPAGRT